MFEQLRFIALAGIILHLSGCYIIPREHEKFAIEKPEPEKAIAKEASPERKIVIEIQHDPSAGVVTKSAPATSCKPVAKKKTKKKIKKKDTNAVAACG